MLLNVDNEGRIAWFHTNPMVYLGLKVSSGAHVKKYLNLFGPAAKESAELGVFMS